MKLVRQIIFRKAIKNFLKIILGFIVIMLLFGVYFHFATRIKVPILNLGNLQVSERVIVNDSTYIFNQNFLRKNSHGIWEMYLKGSPDEIGYSHGILAQELMKYQESAFVQQIKKMIPNSNYLKFLKYILAFMNRNLPDYIALEYQKEIKAVSLFASEEFNFIGDNYSRQLNYHAAHDIGHALQNLNLVACTAFSVWDSLTIDSTLLIGRNFDFYVGDDFAKNKVIFFVSPDSGYNYISVAWAGMSGVVSGMNDQGLSISLNAAKSKLQFSAKTPVSIIAREIVQYASTIDEAYTIACKRPSFVAESFFIGSANDGYTAIIEKSPDTTILFSSINLSKQILTNHFQSSVLFASKLNQENLNENATAYRFKRVEELLNSYKRMAVSDVVEVLRNPYGKENNSIGLGNEIAVNQFIAHHSVVFEPYKKTIWISSPPFQLGDYLPYSLTQVFHQPKILFNEVSKKDIIQSDTFQLKSNYISYLKYKKLSNQISKAIEMNIKLDEDILNQFIICNPNFFYTWELLGDYYNSLDERKQAEGAYQSALKKEIPNQFDAKRIRTKLNNIDFI